MTATPAPAAVPPPVSRMPRAQLRRTSGVIAGLTVAGTAAGALSWPLPERVYDGWQVADVPGSLIALLAVSTLVCLAAATLLTVRDAGLRLGRPSGLAWLAVLVAAAGALVFNALVLAADAHVIIGAIIPIFHWAFTLVPGLLAGAATSHKGAAAAGAAALGTGVVTVPLFALGWALFYSPSGFGSSVASTLWITVILGALPLLVAVASATAWGRTREWRAAAPVR